jgi:hypothetical protein
MFFERINGKYQVRVVFDRNGPDAMTSNLDKPALRAVPPGSGPWPELSR